MTPQPAIASTLARRDRWSGGNAFGHAASVPSTPAAAVPALLAVSPSADAPVSPTSPPSLAADTPPSNPMPDASPDTMPSPIEAPQNPNPSIVNAPPSPIGLLAPVTASKTPVAKPSSVRDAAAAPTVPVPAAPSISTAALTQSTPTSTPVMPAVLPATISSSSTDNNSQSSPSTSLLLGLTIPLVLLLLILLPAALYLRVRRARRVHAEFAAKLKRSSVAAALGLSSYGSNPPPPLPTLPVRETALGDDEWAVGASEWNVYAHGEPFPQPANATLQQPSIAVTRERKAEDGLVIAGMWEETEVPKPQVQLKGILKQ
ncbi:hypothetical protein HK101_000278 [Irineochytrium annulatum]|nr:hypothetical protein HK101_000278 [Irineochytrium annulatum]